MANTKQARKRALQSAKINLHRAAQRSTFRTAIKLVRKKITLGNRDDAQQTLQATIAVIDRLADKNIYHKNKAARHKSRLNAAVKTMRSA